MVDARARDLITVHGTAEDVLFRLTDPALVFDRPAGRIVFVNPAAGRLFGHPAGELLGVQLDSLGLLGLLERLEAAAFDAGGPFDATARGCDGSDLQLQVSLTELTNLPDPVQSGGGCVLALLRDMTERGRVLADRDERLAAALTTVSRLDLLAGLNADFCLMVAHELGNSVAAIRALTDILQAEIIPASQQPSLLATISAETALITRLVSDIAAAAEADRDDFAVVPRPVSLSSLIDHAVAFACSLPGQRDVTEEHEDGVLAAQVLADPDRIGQVLRNLLGNAVKHTPPGTQVSVRTRRVDDSVHIEVADWGPGIPFGESERIFAIYGRGSDARASGRPGAGLGLYLARRFVRAHGSELTVASSPELGAVFGFDLKVDE